MENSLSLHIVILHVPQQQVSATMSRSLFFSNLTEVHQHLVTYMMSHSRGQLLRLSQWAIRNLYHSSTGKVMRFGKTGLKPIGIHCKAVQRLTTFSTLG